MKYWDLVTESKIIYSLGIWTLLKFFYLGLESLMKVSEYWLGIKIKDKIVSEY